MKKSLFAVLFLLVLISLFYSPVERVEGIQNGYCFDGSEGNLFTKESPSQLAFFNLNYEGAEKDSVFKLTDSGISMITKNIGPEGKLVDEEISGVKRSESDGKCQVYTIEVKRNEGLANFELNLANQVDNAGRKSCFYDFTDADIEGIKMIPGKAIVMDNVCPELKNGKEQGSSECDAKTKCDVIIEAGNPVIYGFGIEEDECGMINVKLIGALEESDIEPAAQNFVSECKIKKSINSNNKNRVKSFRVSGCLGGEEEINQEIKLAEETRIQELTSQAINKCVWGDKGESRYLEDTEYFLNDFLTLEECLNFINSNFDLCEDCCLREAPGESSPYLGSEDIPYEQSSGVDKCVIQCKFVKKRLENICLSNYDASEGESNQVPAGSTNDPPQGSSPPSG